MASGWTCAESVVGRAQASSLYNLFYYAGSSLFGWLGGVFFVSWGWAGTAGMIGSLTLVAGISAVLLLKGPDPSRRGIPAARPVSTPPSVATNAPVVIRTDLGQTGQHEVS